MKRAWLAATLAILFLPPLLFGQTKKISPKARAAAAARITRGRYLVEQVGMCGDCHTPRNNRGEAIEEQWLQGASLTFKPIEPAPVWIDKAPNIAGLPGWEKDAAIKYFMTGIGRNGLPGGRPPMPRYRFNEADAEAITAYLKSLALAK